MFKSVRSLATVAEALFMAQTSKTNPQLRRVVAELREVSREAGARVWRDVADRLERSRRNWSEVNLSRLSRYAVKGEQIVVPGVVLATGEISTPITVAAFRASGAARKKIEAAGGKAVSLLELAVQNPKGSGIRIMG
jgi:large subunit ribosomal protein L18e